MAHASQIEIMNMKYDWDLVSRSTASTPITLSPDEDQIGWGTPYAGDAYTSGNGQQSAFRFDRMPGDRLVAEENTLFNVGVFTHLNNVINQGEYLREAQLNLELEVDIDGNRFTVNTAYVFGLVETPNYADPCFNEGANGLMGNGAPKAGDFSASVNRNGCADRVTLMRNDAFSNSFTAGDKTYAFDLFGFGGDNVLWTVENLANMAYLSAQFTVIEDRTPPIPLPAGVWLMLAGIGALAVHKRRRRG